MKIGLFTDQYYPNVSGVVTSIKMLYEGLEAMGHECYIFTSFEKSEGNGIEELKSKRVINLHGIRYPFKAVRNYRFSFGYRKSIKIIAKYDLDIIHVHTEYNIAKIAIRASKKLGIPIVHTLHTSWKDYINYLFPVLDKVMHNHLLSLERKWFTEPISKASVFDIVPTKKILGDLHLYGMSNEVKIVPTGIDIEKFKKDNIDKNNLEGLKKSLGLENKLVFGFIGRTSHEKNIELILEAYAKAFSDNDAVRLLIVGGGPSLDNLKKLASSLNILDKIVFTDLVSWEDIPVYYHLLDVFVNASETETQGLTYIEALASDVVLLVREDECLEDVLIDGYNGLYFKSQEELSIKMSYLYNNNQEIDRMRENTSKSISEYSKENYSKKINDIYFEAISIYKSKQIKK